MESKASLAPVPDVRVDIGALAGTIRIDAAAVLAHVVVQTIDSLDDKDAGQPGLRLNDLQKVELVSNALQEFQGFELRVARELKRTLEHDGVATWGLPEELERALA